MKPYISVIIPIYNAEKYLNKSINSVLNQTIKNIEVILVDDGSSDKSGQIIDKYEEEDSRIVVIHQKNQGVSVARNAGMSIANGQYIGFIDPDDWAQEEMYEVLYSKAIKNNCDIVICDFQMEDINGHISEVIKHPFKSGVLMEQDIIKDEICMQMLIAGIFTSVNNKIYLRSYLEENKIRFLPGINIREDYFFNMDLFNYSKRVFYISTPYYHYQNVPNSASKQYHKHEFEVVLKLYEYKIMYLENWKLNSREVRYKMSSDFLREVKDVAMYVFDSSNLDNFKSKVEKIRSIVNNPTVEKSFDDYKYENIIYKNSIIEDIIINLLKNKSVILLSTMSLIANIKHRISLKK
ncbi:glycosyltransferase [Clostridium estertheticum]|uniref:glycosyltransferase n=1 Tax=Clostridium estertheticum TaxID=238834 RepID=UPI00192260E8|nr:glycosyltransferase [Clostridium estertheticum]MBZ9687727.1 glycosyltransferase [Clostridium estertheticum]